ncbi:MAG: NADH-quinone oxidoreductase subunit H [Sphingobacteriales bacterium]|jgi:NADH-quinone oxidoreductase subunit H
MIQAIIIAIFCVIGFSAYGLVAVYAERKIAAFIQDRLGPMETGWYGLLQTAADILKLLQKEIIVPTAANKLLFALAPMVIFLAVFLGYSVLPFSENIQASGTTLGLFFILAILSLDVIGILMAGWGSNNKYALIGAVRSVAQIISYEIPAGLAIVSVVMISGTLDLQLITQQQGVSGSETLFMGFWDVSAIGGFFAWNIFQAPHLLLAFFIYYCASLAESNRAPFDLPEAESELVAGYHVEYGGFRFGAIMLSEYGMMLLVCLLMAILFFGGYNSPLPNVGAVKLNELSTGGVWSIFWLFSKAFVLLFSHIWIRWTFPRLRIDQLMQFCWKVLTPLGFLAIFLSGIWKIFIA